jgi:hypothetical protein
MGVIRIATIAAATLGLAVPAAAVVTDTDADQPHRLVPTTVTTLAPTTEAHPDRTHATVPPTSAPSAPAPTPSRPAPASHDDHRPISSAPATPDVTHEPEAHSTDCDGGCVEHDVDHHGMGDHDETGGSHH